MNNKKHIKIMSTKHMLCIIYDFVDNINIYFLSTICLEIHLTLLLSEIRSI